MNNLLLSLLGMLVEITVELLFEVTGKSIRSLVQWKDP
jgi:hypothetical protein